MYSICDTTYLKMVNTLIDYDKRKYEQQYIPVVTLTLE